MKVNFWVGVILVIVLFLIFPSVVLAVFYGKKRYQKFLKIFGIVLFCLYILLLSILVFGKIDFKDDVFSVSLEKTGNWFVPNLLLASFGKLNLIVNLVMMFPIAAFVFSQSSQKTFLKTLTLSFVLSVTIEILQFVLPINRTTELLDIFTNTLSGLIGYAYYYLFLKVLRKI